MITYRYLVLAALLVACGGSDNKPADDATTANPNAGPCPPSMDKEGDQCVPKAGSGASTAQASTDTPPAAKVPYDKDNVEMKLRRAADQVKANCGSATDDSGKPGGPWGQTKVTVTLGRNGHVHDVTIPDPYDGKPSGKCAILAFRGLIFPPYAAPADATVEWDVDIEKPGK
ncbi:MAG TPA: hypothetical protein VGH28_18660 [Polyangiaceae bacterium]|jgi:hypothetical protein